MQFGKKMKKVLSTALSIFLMLSVVIQTSIVYAEKAKRDQNIICLI